MKKLSLLKTLPLVGLLALGLSMPAVSLAEKDHGRGKDRVHKKHDGGNGHKSHRDKGHYDRGHGHKKAHKRGHYKGNKHGHRKGHKHAYNKSWGHGHGHKHHGHTHKVYRPHRHDHGHKHVDRVIVHDHYDHLGDYDRFRLMLGLHFDNIDIIFRDY